MRECCFLIGQPDSVSWLLIGCLIVICCQLSEAQTGHYGSKCDVVSDCNLGYVCSKAQKCECDSSYIFDQKSRKCKKICRGSSEGLVRHGSFDEQYKIIKNRYTNCSFVDGNLELTSLEGDYDLGFLKDIEEVDGYVLVLNVFSNYLNLTNLRIIRGKTLFFHKDHNYSLYIALNHNPKNDSQGLLELQFVSLSEIVRGMTYFHNNNLLCFETTIRWEDINPSTIPPVKTVQDSQNYMRQCPVCHHSCSNDKLDGHRHCWGSGPNMCQTLNYIKEVCSETCDGRCFGDQQNQCCHPECAAGCSGGKKTDCMACKNFNNEGACYPFCPQMKVYDQQLLGWVDNPNGTYSFGSLCVRDCPTYLLKDEDACVIKCPPGKVPKGNTCERCDGPCPKNCPGISNEDQFLNINNIEQFRNCTLVQGNIKILKVTFTGDPHAKTPGLSVANLTILKDIREITGFLSIQEAPEELEDLSFLSGLEVIHGRYLANAGLGLSLLQLKIKWLGLTSLKQISNGDIAMAWNYNLCFIEGLDLKELLPLKSQKFKKKENKPESECDALGMKCDGECSDHGCWGPGPDKCLKCKNVRVESDNTCLTKCSDKPLLYATPNNTCEKCDPQCAKGCTGPGPEKCLECKKVVVIGSNTTQTQTRVCMEECPVSVTGMYQYPDENRVCQMCNATCSDRCTGPSSAVMVGGCNTCELAINRTQPAVNRTQVAINGTRENENVHCLPKDQEWCPDSYYRIQFRSSGVNHPLNKKQVCQPCDDLCTLCDSPGPVNCRKCRYFRHQNSLQYSTCLDTCPAYTFGSQGNCLACHSECQGGCNGINNTDCFNCRTFKVLGENSTFQCVDKCPSHLPELVMDTDPLKPSMTVCADDKHPDIEEEERKRILTIALPVCAGVVALGVLLVCFGYCWRAKERSKENTVKLTARMTGVVEAEPLTPTDAKPDLSKLRLIKESDLRRGGIIGSGAFGTVYKGFWVPDTENIKIPVAVKVLQEGTSPNQNQELLEEARVMASVEHPCCIRILAVCMASQMMLITQLMPLGCLLDYIRKHKDNTGSKSLLNWCTQIARGMGYLEDRGIVHRDLAARNVLVQSAGQVKITDFGLAKLLDYNEEIYHAAGGKMPIKWLALECIQRRVFTHKSDVWSFGVTAWELFTYGNRPYENVRARDVPDLLEKGERLPQPNICTIDVYMIMIKCWMLDAESRPSFTELAEEFAKMSRDPGRYLVIQGDALKRFPSEEVLEGSRNDLTDIALTEGDKLMRLPSYSYDKDDLARHLSVAADGPEEVVEADDYLQPAPPTPLAADNNNVKTPLLPCSPGGASNKDPMMLIREKRYGHLESATAAKQQRDLSPRIRGDSINGRYSQDPVKYTRSRDDVDGNVTFPPPHPPMGNGNIPGYHKYPNSYYVDPVRQLPVDEDDYLQPKSANPKAYLDLVDNKDYYLNEKQMSQPPPPPPSLYDPMDNYLEPHPVPSLFENPEYFESDINRDNVFDRNDRKLPPQNLSVKPKIAPKPRRLTDYYNVSPPAGDSAKRLLSNSSNCSNGESQV